MNTKTKKQPATLKQKQQNQQDFINQFADQRILEESDSQWSFHIDIGEDHKIRITTTGGIHIEPLVNILNNAILQASLQCLNQPNHTNNPNEYSLRKEALYDLINHTASGTLRLFAPDLDLRPDITADAILRAENDIINEAAKSIDQSTNQPTPERK